MAVVTPLTRDEAREQGLSGWNVRCNRCGSYGASWHSGRRPGWGDLALCKPHSIELAEELERHEKAMRVLCEVQFDQGWSP